MSHTEGRRGRLGWLAAEFVVVVLGVVGGLAVDAWRDDRANLDSEMGYLERLKANLETDTAAFARAATQNQLRGSTVESFLEVVDGKAPFPADHIAFPSDLSVALSVAFDRSRRDTYDELINQGDLGRVQSPAVREELADYYGVIAGQMAAQFPEWEETATRVEFLFIERLPTDVYRWIQTVGTASGIPDLSRGGPPPSEARVQERVAGSQKDWLARATTLLSTLDAELDRLGRS